MAFEYGALGRSEGGTAIEELCGLMEHLTSGVPGVTHGEIKQGDGWASARVGHSTPDGEYLEQNVQVSIGGEIVEVFLEEAHEILSDEVLAGRNIMLTISASGLMNATIADQIVAYSENHWQGIPWDEVSGFQTSFKRP
ncbi:hypothetical protein NMG29_39480 [Streptomyces cocklensis]|uniref:hypothetical protein n=1 Tax=Actinacidiphila cocklensis TaxID=887465 RepID=UPI00203D9BAD|nr:hypothetical protein [Actinacidiphila cocklensis]MDD1064159.1 hypothetical protein [Actinacidiphila cocklensis]